MSFTSGLSSETGSFIRVDPVAAYMIGIGSWGVWSFG